MKGVCAGGNGGVGGRSAVARKAGCFSRENNALSVLVPPIPDVPRANQKRRAQSRSADLRSRASEAIVRADTARDGLSRTSRAPMRVSGTFASPRAPEPDIQGSVRVLCPKKALRNRSTVGRVKPRPARRPVARHATAVHRRYVCTRVRSSHLASEKRTSVVVKGMQCVTGRSKYQSRRKV